LTEADILDDDDNVIPVYDEDGFPIKRVTARIDRHEPIPSMLANLKSIHRLFSSVSEDEEEFFSTKVYGYSQAFTHLGNFQAQGAIPPFQRRINVVNKSVCRHMGREPPITAPSFQGYNRASHRTRYSASTHEAQTGMFTQILAGTHARTEVHRRKFRDLADRHLSHDEMPFDSLRSRIEDSELEVGAHFRLEVMYNVNMDGLTNEIRNSGE
jgi:hypothetical protein